MYSYTAPPELTTPVRLGRHSSVVLRIGCGKKQAYLNHSSRHWESWANFFVYFFSIFLGSNMYISKCGWPQRPEKDLIAPRAEVTGDLNHPTKALRCECWETPKCSGPCLQIPEPHFLASLCLISPTVKRERIISRELGTQLRTYVKHFLTEQWLTPLPFS